MVGKILNPVRHSVTIHCHRCVFRLHHSIVLCSQLHYAFKWMEIFFYFTMFSHTIKHDHMVKCTVSVKNICLLLYILHKRVNWASWTVKLMVMFKSWWIFFSKVLQFNNKSRSSWTFFISSKSIEFHGFCCNSLLLFFWRNDH